MNPMFSLDEAAAAIGGQVLGDGAIRFSSVGSDSRHVTPGSLFVALKGDNFEGHDHAADALSKGAVAALVNRLGCATPAIVVPDPRAALGALGAAWRSRFSLPLIAVAGSNGKTTVTQMIAAILVRYAGDAAFATKGNFNNDIGVPLTLLRLHAMHRIGVVELGMNHPGEIALVANMAKPTVALINNAQREHLEFMKSVAEVAAENGSVFASLTDDGTAIINADDDFADYWRTLATQHKPQRRVVTFGLNKAADVSTRYELALFGAHLNLRTPLGEAEVALRIAGLHNVRNACAAAAAAFAAGVPLTAIAQGLSDFTPVAGRLVKRVAANGAVVIDDSYNANPDSVRAAIDVLANIPAPRVLILGRMGEVGDQGPAFHREVGAYAKSRGIEALYTLGEDTKPMIEGFGNGAQYFDKVEDINHAVKAAVQPGTTALVKGSLSAYMGRVVAALTGEAVKETH